MQKVIFVYLLTLQHLEEVDGVDIVAGVVLGHARVHIGSVGVVEDDAGGWVLTGVGNVVLPIKLSFLIVVSNS